MHNKIALSIVFFIVASIGYGEEAIKKVCLRDVCVQAEIADTDVKRQQGLMFREGLPEDAGMLFIFEEEARYSFWMKNMRFPLDIIWIDKNKRIVDIKTDVPACNETCESLTPCDKTLYVLEVNAGFTKKNEIKIGDRVSF